MRWCIYPWKKDHHWGATTKTREEAFALAGCRAANSGETQRVWNPETGELWSVRYTWFSGGVRRLKDRPA